MLTYTKKRVDMKWIITLLMISSAYGKNLYPGDLKSGSDLDNLEIITNSIFDELIIVTKGLKPPKQVEPKKESINNMSRGKQMIEQMKRKNREELAKKNGINPDEVKSGADLVKAAKEDNKQLVKQVHATIKTEGEWRELAESEIEALKNKVISDWKKKHAAKIKHWEAQRRKFNKEKGKYEDTTFELPLILPVSKEEKEKVVEIEIERDYFVVPAAMNVEIRDQKFRPTCSAFAGVRLMEILLAQNGQNIDLSEQYFYWASKEDCQKRPCSKPGSWVGYGLEYSKDQRNQDIPLEKECPYVSYSSQGNETQTPLASSCRGGTIKVGDFSYLKTLDEVMKALHKNNAVVASLKLTPNFYTSRSLILYKDRSSGGKMDTHSQGHAVTIVGYAKLPSVLDEGRVCFIVANSWGEGWGKGGYSCISEKWILAQRQDNPFVTISYLSL
ncbi:MAG: hypothetical protein CME71_01925 [Halobacteriovorax sp.]|mgnify:CR=1 FL=1|nr:hypothetical protein [Halobacteriovorax sp.]|tara:strand:+ start:147 stop:1478 length:1332 start_codon:yes stop_codon:yes gene_type:complete